jgi:riboflavin kinase/FMN adenylyltransferase
MMMGLSEVDPRPRRVAVGKFDGVHLGHRPIVGGCDTVLTFEPHPLAVLRPESAPKLLGTLADRARRLARLGVAEVVVMPFDASVARLSAREFIESVLVGRLGAVEISVGANFRFGSGAAGDVALLASDPRFVTRVSPLVRVEGEVVSSSRVRALVQAGEVERAAVLLDGPFRLAGRLGPSGRGRAARIVRDPALACPAPGRYACRVGDASGGAPATLEIGAGMEARLEDHPAELHGRELIVEFLRRLDGVAQIRPKTRRADARTPRIVAA